MRQAGALQPPSKPLLSDHPIQAEQGPVPTAKHLVPGRHEATRLVSTRVHRCSRAHAWTADLALLVSLALLIADAQLVRRLSLLHHNHLEASSSQPFRMCVIVFLRKATMRLLSLTHHKPNVSAFMQHRLSPQ